MIRSTNSSILVLAFFMVIGTARASVTDSLWGIWNTPGADSTRFNALGRLSREIMFEQPDSALTIAQLLYEKAGEKKDRRAQAMALTYQGIAYTALGNQFAARQSYLEMLEMYTLVGDLRGVAGARLNLGALYHGQGQLAKAVEWYTMAVVEFEELSDKRGLASTYNNLSGLYHDLGDTTEAMAYAERCLAVDRELGDQRAIAGIMGNMAQIHLEAGRLAEAMALLRESLRMRTALSDPSGEAHVLHDIGEVFRRRGMEDSALWCFERSAEIREQLKDESGLTLTRTSLGFLALDGSRYQDAADLCGTAAAIARDLGAMPLERKACDCLYKAMKALGREKEALDAFERYTVLGDSIAKGDSEKKLQQMEFVRRVVQDSLARAEKIRGVEKDKARSRARMPFVLSGGAIVIILLIAARRRARGRRS